jgi:hypothetical protein
MIDPGAEDQSPRQGPSESAQITLGVQGAAKFLRMSEDTLMRKARAGFIPGAKIGREWVFLQADLIDLIRKYAQERATAVKTARTGGARYQSLAERLAARRVQRKAEKQKNSKPRD